MKDDRATLARLSLVRRASWLAVRSVTTVGRYELERVLRPYARLEADTKLRLGRALLEGAGLELDVVGEIPLSSRPRLIVANHRSAFDIALMLALVDDPVMLSRGDLKGWPVLGRLAELGDTLFVDRADRADGARAIRAMRRALERKRTVCVFPEGTTHGEPHVRPFQAGAFAAARGLGTDVLPVGIAYAPGLEFVQPSMGAHLSTFLQRPDLRMSVVVGEPIRFSGRRTDAMTREAHAAVQALFEAATTRLRP